MQPITPDNDDIETIGSLIYIGAVIDTNDNATTDIANGIEKIAREVYYKLTKIWASNLYSRNIKKKIYEINLISVLLHWTECWNISKRNGEIYNTFNTSNWKIVRIFGQLYFPTQNCCKEPICAALPTLIRPGDRVRQVTS